MCSINSEIIMRMDTLLNFDVLIINKKAIKLKNAINWS